MQRVLRKDERLAALVKPPMEPVDEIRLGAGDMLMVCAGFEERAVAVLRSAARHGKGFRVLIIKYLPAYVDNRIDELSGICSNAKVTVEFLTYDRRNPAGFEQELNQKLGDVAQRVFVDISGMSRLLIVQTLVALHASPRNFKECYIAYAEAQVYPPNREEVEKAILEGNQDPMFAALFLSSGVFEVTIVPELSAASLGASQSRLVVFPSFNSDQLTALRAELQPSRYAYIHGIPPSSQNKWRREAIIRLNRIEGSKPDENFETSTLDYRETVDCLCKIYAEFAVRDRLLVSPTGSKMQVVAVGIFRALVEDVQVVYPTPCTFHSPKTYTTGVGQLHLLSLEQFGAI